MAQIVGYFENNVTFTEGPFVLVYINGWRIEAEHLMADCPVLPDSSIYEIKNGLGWTAGKTEDKALAIKVCDELNKMVVRGEIVLDGKVWRKKKRNVQ